MSPLGGRCLSHCRSFRYAYVMRNWPFILGVFLLITLVAVPLVYMDRQPLDRHWTLYRIGAAASSQEAEQKIIDCETSPDRDVMIDELVRKWGTGSRPFDLHLAAHVGGKSCGEPLREAFARELGQRDGLLGYWAHYWTWRAQLPPDQQTASVVVYHDALAAADPPRSITWREVLDLQAVFQLTGRSDLARDVSPTNWRDRYGEWQRSRAAQLPRIARPEDAFP